MDLAEDQASSGVTGGWNLSGSLSTKDLESKKKTASRRVTLMMSLENEYITREGKSLLMLPAQVLHSHHE